MKKTQKKQDWSIYMKIKRKNNAYLKEMLAGQTKMAIQKNSQNMIIAREMILDIGINFEHVSYNLQLEEKKSENFYKNQIKMFNFIVNNQF